MRGWGECGILVNFFLPRLIHSKNIYLTKSPTQKKGICNYECLLFIKKFHLRNKLHTRQNIEIKRKEFMTACSRNIFQKRNFPKIF